MFKLEDTVLACEATLTQKKKKKKKSGSAREMFSE